MESDFFLCKKCMKLKVKYYFLADILFLGVVLDFNKYIFPWQMCFMLEVVWQMCLLYVGGCLRLESSCIQVNK